jgi:hypothetical protein
VYVAGTTCVAIPGGDCDLDYVTAKYSSTGNLLWLKTYGFLTRGADRAAQIAVDGSGNVYVTGTSKGAAASTAMDYATLKYDPDGTLLWVQRYDGPAPGNDLDFARGLALDANGNVYVTGASKSTSTNVDYLTLKYDTDGNLLWEARRDSGGIEDGGYAVTTDSSGYVYVTGRYDRDWGTIKYDADGNELWLAVYESPTLTGDGKAGIAIAVDGCGNVHVTGSAGQGSNLADYATLKYDADGNELWAVHYDQSGGDDRAAGLALDGAGNVYVTGSSRTSDGGVSAATIKYGPDGTEQWVARFTDEGLAGASAIAVDAAGQVNITGASQVHSGVDMVTVRYNPDGSQECVMREGEPEGYGEGRAIALDAAGNVHVTGRISRDFENDMATVKYATGCAVPQVEGLLLNDGSAQRSRVTSLTVTFNGVLTLDPGAFELLRQGGGLVSLDVAASVVDGRTVAVLTFAGEDVVAGSLADGNYTLTLRADLLRDAAGRPLDGDGDGTPGGDRVESFFRYFGDSDGDRDVDEADQALFDSTFGRSAADEGFLAYFDFDGDGDVDEADRDQFLLRLGSSLGP